MSTVIVTAFTLIAFAGNSLLCRMALGENLIDPLSFTALRLGSGAVALVAIARAFAKPGTRQSTDGSWTSGSVLFLYAIAFSLAYVSLNTGMGALILFGAVQVTMIGAALISGERLGPLQWLGAVAAIGGLVYLVLPGISAPNPIGVILMACAGIAWGVYSIRGKGVSAPVPMTARNFLWSAPLALVALMVGAAAPSSVHVQPAGVLLALTSGIITSGLGYILWYTALKSLTTTQASVLQLLVPVLAALGGIAFLSEQLTTRLLIASALILGGVAMAILMHRPMPARS